MIQREGFFNHFNLHYIIKADFEEKMIQEEIFEKVGQK